MTKTIIKVIDSHNANIIPLTHYKQKYNWDCGLSCILMILSTEQRNDFLQNFTKICREENFNNSTWTIDLSYLLAKYDIKHIYCTITIGIQLSYVNNTFYSSIIKKDQERINNKFKHASENGIQVKCKSLSLEGILHHLNSNGPIIVLTNANLLSCNLCNVNTFIKCLKLNVNQYQGHYVVLCGYDINTQLIYYRNPTYHERLCSMSFTTLDKARTAYGTDEDIILIFSKN